MKRDVKRYITSKHPKLPVLELLACITFALVIKYGNLFLWSAHERPIPYQVTSQGDVILDFSLMEKDNGVDVPTEKNYVICLLGPVICFIAFSNLLPSASYFAPYGDLHCSSCVLSVAFGLDSLICDPMKRYVGRLRPIFYDYCNFNVDTLECEKDDFTEARYSFPSGHTHVAFACMTVLTLYLLGKANATSEKREEQSKNEFKSKILILLSLSPMLYAVYIGAMVIVCNWHFPSDVIAGALIGSISALTSYHLWYHPVYSDKAGTPLRNYDYGSGNSYLSVAYLAYGEDNEMTENILARNASENL